MRREREQGSITVFLAITFLFIMAMLGTLIDGARLVEANTQVYYAADLAATSALAQFRYDLKDRYGLFAYENDPKNVMQQVVLQNLNLSANREISPSEALYQKVYYSVLQAVGITDPARDPPSDLLQLRGVQALQAGIPVTLADTNEFERQIFEYVKFRGPVELFQGDLTLDFTNLSKELEKAKNEDTADKAMDALQEKLAEHYDKQADYNEALKKFQEKLQKISDEKYDLVLRKLEASPSIEGLSGLKSPMSNLSGALVLREECSEMLNKIRLLQESCEEIVAEADAMEQRFSGAGENAQFDGQDISGEMLSNYKSDLQTIRADAQLKWADGSSTEGEREKYRRIQSETKAIQTSIQNYIKRIHELEEEAENEGDGGSDEEREEESLAKKIDKLWENLEAHFGGSLYYGGDRGVFSDTANLKNLVAHNTDTSQKDLVKEWTKQAKQASEKNKRNYKKSIPSGYRLPSSISAEEVKDALSVELEGNLETTKKEIIQENREKNREVTKDVKGLFQGVAELTLDTFDNAMLGLYALGNFQNALCHEGEKPEGYRHKDVDVSRYSYNMRNDKIEDGSICFDDCEVEYLIKGNRSEKKNYQGIRNELTGLYFTLNYAAVRKPAEIHALVESVARAVEVGITGATLGVGAGAGVIAYYATREACYAALATIQTSHDLERLYYGNKVPLLKRQLNDFCGLKMFGASCTDDASVQKIPIGYADYLFIRMIITGQNKLRGRLQDLVELNMNTSGGSTDAGRPFELANARTSASVRVDAEMPFFFINVIFRADGMSGSGIKVSKYASQKY